MSAGADITVSQSLLTQQGVPVIGLSNGKSYCFSLSLETWWVETLCDTPTDKTDKEPVLIHVSLSSAVNVP